MDDDHVAEAIDQGGKYLFCAAKAREMGLLGAAALYQFASKQMEALIWNGDLWHWQAASAAAHEATAIMRNETAGLAAEQFRGLREEIESLRPDVHQVPGGIDDDGTRDDGPCGGVAG